MVTFILIRHGESKDNLCGVWAGHKDSPLSTHGVRQAEALAADLARQKLTAIYSSDLSRARTTAKVIKEKQTESSVPFERNAILREQSFGAGEGMKIAKKEKGMTLVAHFAQGMFPALHSRTERFPGGESLDDMAKRAEEAIGTIMLPHLLKEQEDGVSATVAIVSHGLFIGELVMAVLKQDGAYPGDMDVRNLRGMKNTGWTRLEIKMKSVINSETSSSSSRPFTPLPALVVKVTGVNRHAHLSNLHRQKGGIGSMAHDPAQTDIRAFIGKQKTSSTREPRPKPY